MTAHTKRLIVMALFGAALYFAMVAALWLLGVL